MKKSLKCPKCAKVSKVRKEKRTEQERAESKGSQSLLASGRVIAHSKKKRAEREGGWEKESQLADKNTDSNEADSKRAKDRIVEW